MILDVHLEAMGFFVPDSGMFVSKTDRFWVETGIKLPQLENLRKSGGHLYRSMRQSTEFYHIFHIFFCRTPIYS